MGTGRPMMSSDERERQFHPSKVRMMHPSQTELPGPFAVVRISGGSSPDRMFTITVWPSLPQAIDEFRYLDERTVRSPGAALYVTDGGNTAGLGWLWDHQAPRPVIHAHHLMVHEYHFQQSTPDGGFLDLLHSHPELFNDD